MVGAWSRRPRALPIIAPPIIAPAGGSPTLPISTSRTFATFVKTRSDCELPATRSQKCEHHERLPSHRGTLGLTPAISPRTLQTFARSGRAIGACSPELVPNVANVRLVVPTVSSITRGSSRHGPVGRDAERRALRDGSAAAPEVVCARNRRDLPGDSPAWSNYFARGRTRFVIAWER